MTCAAGRDGGGGAVTGSGELDVFETFVSIQGESTWAGLPCFFVRLAGCNLRCRYCDTGRAWTGGVARSVASVTAEFVQSGVRAAEITGGEPLLQPEAARLAEALLDAGAAPLLVETNGTCGLSAIPAGAIAIVDVKTPGSGAGGSFDVANLARLRPADEVKFVIVDREDFDWAADFVERHALSSRCRAVLFSAASGLLEPSVLGQWVLASKLTVRMQVQLHTVLGIK